MFFLRMGSGKTHTAVIMDGKKLSEDEDDEDGQFVVEEAAPPPADVPEMEVVWLHCSLHIYAVFRKTTKTFWLTDPFFISA